MDKVSTDRGDDEKSGDERKLLSGLEEVRDVLSELSLGNLDIVLGISVVVHEVEESVKG